VVCHPNHASPEPEPSLGLQAAWNQPGLCEADRFEVTAMTTSTSPLWIGIDVAKDHLDVHVRPRAGLSRRQRRGRHHRPDQPASANPSGRLVLEATGGYEIPVVAALAAAGLAPAVSTHARHAASPRASVAWPRPIPLDAAVLAHFAEAVRPEARPVPDADARVLSDLLARRRQLVQMRGQRAAPLAHRSGPIRRASSTTSTTSTARSRDSRTTSPPP